MSDQSEQNEPTQRIPVENLSTQRIPLENVPTQRIPLENVPTQRIPVENVPTQRVPVENVPTQRIPAQSEATARISHELPTEKVPTQAAVTPTFLDATAGGRTTADTAATGVATGRYEPTGTLASPAGNETRFGPGVPAAAPAGPSWPSTAPPPVRPRRSPWRVVGSVLSGLLTVALLAVVGLYLWERINPLEIESVTATVMEPPGNRCDITVDVAATVRTNGNAGTIRYQWLRVNAEPTSLLTEHVGRGQRTVTLHLKWAFSGVGTTKETAIINITSPAPIQSQTSFVYNCPRN